MIMVNEFRKKYAQGSPNALAAYDTLNMFYIDEEKSHKNTDNLLGTFILEQADVAFFEKYIQRGNSQIFSAVLAALGGATTDYEEDGKTWMERSKDSDIAQLYAQADSAERNQYDTWYKDPALTFIRDIQTFADTYHEAVEKREKYGDAFGYTEKDGIDEESTLDEILEANPNCRIPEYVNALLTYDLLDGYAYGKDGVVMISFPAVKQSKSRIRIKRRAAAVHDSPKVLISISLAHASWRDFLSGILRYVERHTNWDIRIMHEPGDLLARQIDDAEHDGYAGIILATPGSIDFDRLCRSSIPLADCDGRPELRRRKRSIVHLLLDNAAIGTVGARHLLGRGRCAAWTLRRLWICLQPLRNGLVGRATGRIRRNRPCRRRKGCLLQTSTGRNGGKRHRGTARLACLAANARCGHGGLRQTCRAGDRRLP